MTFGMCLRALALCGAVPAQANSITFEIWPTADPDDTVSCTLRLARGEVMVLEVKGLGMPPARPVRWFASDAESNSLVAALQALIGGRLASVEPIITSRLPAPPFITATWMATLDQGLASGLYIQPGLILPPELADVLATLTPTGICTAAITAL